MFGLLCSPWGMIQSYKQICPGVIDVSTASHGGIMVEQEAAFNILSVDARRCGFWEGRYLCFEEDCAAAVVIRELLDKKLYDAPVNEHWEPGEYSLCINKSLQRYYPDYWEAYVRFNRPDKACRKRSRNDYER